MANQAQNYLNTGASQEEKIICIGKGSFLGLGGAYA